MFLRFINILTLVASSLLLASLSVEIIYSEELAQFSELYSWVMFAVCLIFCLDFFALMAASDHPWRFLVRNFIVLVLSVPYHTIFSLSGVVLGHTATMVMSGVAMLRSVMAIYITLRWLISRRASRLLGAYKLATYASRCIENEILMHIRKCSNTRSEISIDEPLNVDWDGNELLLSDILGNDEDCISYDIQQREEKEAVRRAVSQLGEREQLIINLRYGLNGKKEMTQKEVADLLGISQSYISRLEKKILSQMREEMLNLI